MKLKKLLAAAVSAAMAVSAAENEWTKDDDNIYSYTCVETDSDTDELYGTPVSIDGICYTVLEPKAALLRYLICLFC